jgi:hypothetical protein
MVCPMRLSESHNQLADYAITRKVAGK